MVYSGEKSDVLDGSPDSHNVGVSGGSKGEEPKVWEHPWTTNEIRKNSANWTLAGDVGLLNHLKQFSHNLLLRTHEMENIVDSLVHKSKVASAKVNNVINDFQMLSNVQFVENRVYDEEAKDPEPPVAQEAQMKSKEQRESEMVPRLIEALQLGISVMDKAFEKIDVDEMSDSDEEELSQGRSILEPVDLYEHRPLPYIIGSEEFQRDDSAGLHHLLYEEDISTDISTQDENVSASAESEEEESEEESDLEETPRKPTVIKHKETKSSIDTLQERLSDSGSSDLFDAHEDEAEDGFISGIVTEEKPKDEKLNFIEELKKKTQPESKSPNVAKPPVASSPIKDTPPKDEHDLFTSSDSFFDEDESPFRKKSGLFSSDSLFGKTEEKDENGLFDDDEEEVVAPVKKKDVVPVKKKDVVPVKKKDVVPVKKKDVVPVKKKDVAPKPKVTKPEPVKEVDIGSRSSPGLFDEFDDSEHDLFSSISVKSTSAVKSKTQEPVISTKEKRSPSITSTSSKKTVKSQSLVEDTKSSNSLFGEDSDDNDLFSTPSKPKEKAFEFGSASFENEEDDLFSTKTTNSKKGSIKDIVDSTPKKSETKQPSLFEESDHFDLFKPVKEKPSVKTDLPKVKQTVTTASKETTPKVPVKEKQPSLFEDSDNFDLFKPSVRTKSVSKSDIPVVSEKKPKSTTIEKPSLFDDSDPFDLFGASQPANKPPPKEKIIEKPQIKKKIEPVLPTKSSPAVQVTSSSIETVQTDTPDDSSLSFDQPISSNTVLNVINKDRVKIQTKRRKPTRKGRQSRISSDLDSSKEEEYVTTSKAPQQLPKSEGPEKSIPSQPSKDVSTSKPASSSHKQKEQSRKNLMSALISEAAISKIGKRNSLVDENEEELFADLNKKPLGSDFSLVSPTSKKNDIFEDSSEGPTPKTSESGNILSDSTDDDDLFAAPAFSDFKSNISEKNSIFDDDDDDIFKPLKNKDTGLKSSDGLLDSDEDDIFAGVDKEKYEMSPKMSIGDEDDDDIFSTVAKTSKTATKSQTAVKKQSKDNDIFSDPLGLND